MGSLSSWYLFSPVGFYPVVPGSNVYMIGSPAFDAVSIRVKEGKTFTVRAGNNSRRNVYIQSARLNGKPYDSCKISHADIVSGGELVFQMGDSRPPDRVWALFHSAGPSSLATVRHPWKIGPEDRQNNS